MIKDQNSIEACNREHSLKVYGPYIKKGQIIIDSSQGNEVLSCMYNFWVIQINENKVEFHPYKKGDLLVTRNYTLDDKITDHTILGSHSKLEDAQEEAKKFQRQPLQNLNY